MKLLIFAQKVDSEDPVLGFFHRWVEEFSQHVEKVTVICLYEGTHNLPQNVSVFSLGKEKGNSRIQYVLNFFKYVWQKRSEYDSVFVHMNQEYILLGGLFWKLFGKKVYMWRNHHAGTFLTDIAAFFCTKVFCTSQFSYTAKYKKTKFMPVGVDTNLFKADGSIPRDPKGIVSLGRISPSKYVEVFIDAVTNVHAKDSAVSGHVYGSPLPVDEGYYQDLKKRSGSHISFHGSVTNTEAIQVYPQYNIFINTSSSGMYDKTIFEAMASGCLVLASNDNLRGKISDDFVFKHKDTAELSVKLQKMLEYTPTEREERLAELGKFVQEHSLTNLSKKLFTELV